MSQQLTDAQRRAAVDRSNRLFIVAGPGAGKTTVAAERFGVERFRPTGDQRGVLALSFTRSATGELRRRIQRHWGSAALEWPHRVTTIDSLMCEIVQCLLRRGVLQWPEGHTTLTVLDTWRGQRGCRYLTANEGYRRVAVLSGTNVASAGRRVTTGQYGIGKKSDFEAFLADGICTHDEIRDVMRAGLKNDAALAAMDEYMSRSIRALIVDEIFDANPLDMALVGRADEAGIPITVIGDPWQALYEFRGARPDLVVRLSDDESFSTHTLTQSFRYRTDEMSALATRLRDGKPVALVTATKPDDADVALAGRWDALWDCSSNVLPMSFGAVGSQTDAALTLVLDSHLRARFGERAIYAVEATHVLRLIEVDLGEIDEALVGVFRLVNGFDPAGALQELRAAVKELGSRRPPKLQPGAETRAVRRLQLLGDRVSSGASIRGMTVHQAKGQEWPQVGVVLSDDQLLRLGAGLEQGRGGDRMLYVALTRAQDGTFRVR